MIRTSVGRFDFSDYGKLLEAVRNGVIRMPDWIAKCVGNDEETIKMRSFLLDMCYDGVVHFRDGWFAPATDDLGL